MLKRKGKLILSLEQLLEMQNFQKYGFNELTSEQLSGLRRLNPKLEPLCQRYQGMGWVDVIVKCNQKYKMVNMGGENGYTAEKHNNEYAALDNSDFISEAELLQSLAGSKYAEVQEVVTKKV